MTFIATYIDGEETMVVEFEDRAGYFNWQTSMSAIKQEVDRIVDANSDAANQSIAQVDALRNWLRCVDAMVEAGTPVAPSILRVRIEFAEAISDSTN
jgi:hypothetical protein